MKHLNELIETVETALKHLKLAQEAFSKLNLGDTTGKVETVKEEESEDALYLKEFCETSEVHKKLVERLVKNNALKEYVEEHKRQVSYPYFGESGKMNWIGSGKRNSGINWNDSKQGWEYWVNILGYHKE